MKKENEKTFRRPKSPDEELPLEAHLEELAERLKKSLIVFAIVFVIITFVPINLEYSYVPLVAEASRALVSYVVPQTVTWMGKTYNVTILYTGAFEGFSVLLYTSLLFTLIITAPYIGYQVYAFIEPALYPHEKKFLKNGIYAGVGLFVFGVALGYFVLAPITLRIMLLLQAVPLPPGSVIVGLTMNNLLSFIIKLSLTTGIAFLFPLIIYYLIVFGVVDASKFEGFNARLAFVIIMAAAAIITPDPSGVTMLILAVPYYILFMLGVKLAKRTVRKKKMTRPS
jgi:Twin arginine targeting (Tat) protein translocase TatC